MDTLPVFPTAIAAVAAIVIGVWDFRSFRIPNFLTLPLLLTGLLYHGWLNGGGGVVASALGAFVGGSILIVPYLMGGIGGGDVKLLAAMGAWLQSRSLLLAFGVGGLLIGTLALVQLCRRRSLQQATVLSWQIAKSQLLSLGRSLALDDRVELAIMREDRRQRLIPFGVCFAIALCLLVGWRLVQNS
jgi:prepilin peptidase CpaA